MPQVQLGWSILRKLVHTHWKLALVLLLYLTLSLIYSVVVPIGRGADEWAHYWYAQFIAENRRLPASPGEREAAGYKSDWPPLYHLFAAGISSWIDTEGPPTFKYREDNIRRQLVPAQGPEAILHTEDELFPWQQEILIWHLGRLLSIAFSLGVLITTYFIALEVFTVVKFQRSKSYIAVKADVSPESSFGHSTGKVIEPKTMALISVACLAFILRFLFTGMLFNYDSLTLLLASLFFWLGLRIAKGYYARWGFWAWGAVAGLALVTKYLAALLPLEIVVIAFIRSSRQRLIKSPTGKLTRTAHPASRLNWPIAVHLGQAALPFLLVTAWWFTYLLINFNEIGSYGPVLGTLAPLIRGDGSDRTVEEIFAFLSRGQAPEPAYIQEQTYTAGQIISRFVATFWGNPIIQPYPLNWFVWTMTLLAAAAAIGIGLHWLTYRAHRIWINLLLLHCALALPLMLIRLFGARDALEAVQGRHILFLAGPAVTVLLVLGLVEFVSRVTYQSKNDGVPRNKQRVTYISQQQIIRLTFYALLGLLLTGAIAQLIFMERAYPPLLPVRTGSYSEAQINTLADQITVEGGARVMGFHISDENGQALRVNIYWQAGRSPAPEDYQMELALINPQGQVQSGWRAYQTQACYPTRVWEAGDTVRDEGWLPLKGLDAGDYEIQLRILGELGPVVDWLTLTTYRLHEAIGHSADGTQPVLWQGGQVSRRPPTLRERQTAQLTFGPNAGKVELIGPDGKARMPVSAGSGWANFIIGPDWPAGDYYVPQSNDRLPLLRVVESERNYQLPQIAYPLEVNFGGKIKLLGYDLPSRRVEPGDGLPITLYWQGLEWMGEEFVIFDRLLDNPQDNGQPVAWGGYDRLARENYSTLLWAPGEFITDGFAVPVAANAPDGIYTLSLGWYREVEGQAVSLPILNPETGRPTDATSVMIGPIKVGGAPPGLTVTEAAPHNELNIVLGEKIKLIGFDIANQPGSQAANGGSFSTPSTLYLTFYWRAVAPVDIDYTVFTHLRDAAGETVAQKDRPPADGAYPTSLWALEEIIKDEMSVSLGHLEPGRYDLVVGMYDLDTGVRLSVDGSSDGTIVLESFQVGE